MHDSVVQRAQRNMELPGAAFLILSHLHLMSPCHCQYVWPRKASDVMFAAQVGTNGTEVLGCTSPGEGYVFLVSRLSSGLFYREDEDLKSFEEAEQTCSASGAHLPTFKTQEEYEILLELLAAGDLQVWLGLNVPLDTGCNSFTSCQKLLQWHDGTTLEDNNYFAASFARLENSDSLRSPCLVIGQDGAINTPEDGCLNGVARTICQYQCSDSSPTAQTCPPARSSFSVVESVDYDNLHAPSNMLRRKPYCDDHHNTDISVLWAAPHDDQTPHIIFDVGCEFQATTIVLWNAPSRHWQNGGVKTFQVSVALTLDSGQWEKVAGGALPSMWGIPCREQRKSVFTFPATPARYVKLQVLDIWDRLATLQYFDIY